MIRYVLLVLDLSRAATATDMRPSRLSAMAGSARGFIRRFFDLNPLGQLALAVLRNGIAEQLTDLSGSPEAQIDKLNQFGMDAGGDASLQNGLEMGLDLLGTVPPYGHREMLVIMAALSTVDPGRVEDSIHKCREAKIRVSVVGVAAEVHILRRTAEQTGGTYGVAMNETHLQDLVLAHAPPPPAPPGLLTAELVRMGFPQRAAGDANSGVFVGELPMLLAGAYTCPRCKARTQELPCRCHVCGLTLISSPHLARSYHHLFPVPPYQEVDERELTTLAAAAAVGSTSGFYETSAAAGMQDYGSSSHVVQCYGCLRQLVGGKGPNSAAQPSMVLRCNQCKQLFCFDCDAFVHETLHNCPGCECGVEQQRRGSTDSASPRVASQGLKAAEVNGVNK
eukprot:GHRR01017131.1.p1 GENE.GHRR01017131.1~~GHRR01017131.1.p1  ORF type:complete len:394 (+),score=126.77 GHRR01017131.1:120-1301(+)